MSKYECGDRVLVRSDLIENESYRMEDSKDEDVVVSEMVEFVGKVVTVDKVLPFGSGYRIIEDNCLWVWTDGMFASLTDTMRLKRMLEDGDVVQDREGDKWIVLSAYDEKVLMSERSVIYNTLSMYDSYLNCTLSESMDIMSISKISNSVNTLSERFALHDDNVVWEREEDLEVEECVF